MAFTVNDISLNIEHGLATLTLHEAQGRQNRVVYVVVPSPASPRLTAAARRKQARASAKDALKVAAAAL